MQLRLESLLCSLSTNYLKCNKPIRTRPWGFPAPSFWGQRKEEIMTRPIKAQFWYCPDNAHGCLSSHPRVVVLGRPTTTPEVWPVLCGTNLTQDEADQLSTADLVLLPHPDTPPPRFHYDLLHEFLNVKSALPIMLGPTLVPERLLGVINQENLTFII